MRNSFNNVGVAVAARPFKFNGVDYAVGDHFPHKELGPNGGPMIELDLRGLWMADAINFVDPTEVSAGNPVKVAKKAKAKQQAEEAGAE